MKQTMLWMLGLCMAILPTGRPHAAEFAETTETTESTDPAVCDTIFMTWTAAAGVEKPLSIGVEAPEAWNGSRTFWVNFGDGSYLYSSAVDTAFTKTYTEAGSYNVTITVSQPEVRITSFNCFDYNAGTDNGVTSLDVSGCTALKVLGCSNNRLTSLYVGTCTALTQLGCNDNPLSSLDVSRNTVLTTLHCANTQLTSLDVTRNTALVKLQCSYNGLTSLDVSQNTALMWLECYNTQLTSLDVSRNPALKELQCFDNSRVVDLGVDNGFDLSTLPGMDVSRIGGVTGGRLEGSRLIFEANEVSYYYKTHFQGEVALALDSVWFKLVASVPLTPTDPDEPTDPTEPAVCDTIFMTWTAEAGEEKPLSIVVEEPEAWDGAGETFWVDFGDGTELHSYALSDTSFTKTYAESGSYNVSVGVSSLEIRIVQFNCGGTWEQKNGLTSLDVSRCTALTWMDCSNNQLTSLDVSANTALMGFRCSVNQLTALDVSANTALTDLSCSDNQLTSLDVSANTALTWLHCDNNQLTTLDVNANIALQYLNCGWNQLTFLDVRANKALKYLYCYYNQVTSLDVSANTALDCLVCVDNRLMALDVSANTALTRLDCGRNQLTSLDVSANTALTELTCYDNQLTSLDVSANTALTTLSCGSNQLTSLDVGANTALTEMRCNYNHLTVDLDTADSFDMNTLPALDVSRIGGVTGGRLEGSRLIFETERVTYRYATHFPGEASLGFDSVEFTLVASAPLTPTEPAVCDTIFMTWTAEAGEEKDFTFSGTENGMFIVNWGDGTDEMVIGTGSKVDVNPVYHRYAKAGIYNVTVAAITPEVRITYLWCVNAFLMSLDVTKISDLGVLGCFGNQLMSLDVSQSKDLSFLYCNDNQLKLLDVSQNPALIYLICHNNQLTSLDVSKNPALDKLYCKDNQLTSLDLRQNPSLTEFRCYPNSNVVDLDTANSFDLNTLPIMDVSRIGSVHGGHMDGSRLIFETDRVTYRYATHFPGDASLGFDSVEFTLIASESVTLPTDPTVPSDTLVPENGVGWIWMASAGEEKEIEFKGTGKGFRVDWGDGNVSEAKGGAAADAAFAMVGADGAASITSGGLAASASAPAAKDSEKELKHRYAKEGVYTVTLAPLSQNGRLTDLDVSDERVLALAFGDASMLETLDCSDNLLTELALPAAAKLKDLDCSENLLAALDLSGCSALQEVDFSDNRLTSLALPTHASLKDVEGEDNRLRLSDLYDLLSGRVKNASYEFDPQSDSVTVTENAVFDLVSEMSIGGRATTYTLLDAATRRPAPASDYAADGGLFRFSKPGARYVLTLKNANVTDYEKGRADEVVTFTWYISVSGVGNEDLASDEAASAPWAYVQGRTIYLTSDVPGGADLGEVEAFTAVGQRVYRGYDRAFTVPTAGIYVLRAADGRRCKVLVR